MPKSKTAATSTALPSSSPAPKALAASLPPQRLFIHLLATGFSALYLPRSTSVFTTLPPPPSSLDRPEPEWLQPLTASPILTLAWLCLGSAALAVDWCGNMRAWVVFERVPNAKDDEELMKRYQDGKKAATRDAARATAASTLFFYILATLFGAPIASYNAHTLLLSLLVSLLAVFPATYALGLPLFNFPEFSPTDPHYARWMRVFAARAPLPRSSAERHLLYAGVGAVLGAWVGAFPIALDWDRPWQAWPLTPAYGAILGYIGGSIGAAGLSFFTQAVALSKAQ